MNTDFKELMTEAVKTREKAYAPYSAFKVGAALLCADGKIYCGCNIENASYSATICAERSAFAAAVSEGKRDFKAIAVVGGEFSETDSEIVSPCGVCRQFMTEFCSSDFKVVLGTPNSYRVYELGELVPLSFGKEHLNKTR